MQVFVYPDLTNLRRCSRNTRAMAKAKQAASKKVTPIAYTLTMDKRRAKILLNMLGAIELRMFEKGYRPTEGQMNTVAELRRQLSEQVHGQPEASLEEQLAAAVEWSGGHK